MITSGILARWGAIAGILLACVGCDQVTKELAQSQLKGRAPLCYLGDTLRLDYAENPGAFLGLGGEMPEAARWVVLVGVNALMAVGIGAALLFGGRMPRVQWFALSLLLAGAVGNLIDRVRFDGLVIDFMNMGIGPLRTGIFNVADVAITVGAVLLLLPLISSRRPETLAPQQA